MTEHNVRTSEQVTVADLVEHLNRFEGPPEEFLLNLLAAQCRMAAAKGGAILRAGAGARPEVVAVYPPFSSTETAPVWLAQSVESAQQVMSSEKTIVRPFKARYNQPSFSKTPNCKRSSL